MRSGIYDEHYTSGKDCGESGPQEQWSVPTVVPSSGHTCSQACVQTKLPISFPRSEVEKIEIQEGKEPN
jgi:hypothetical protein